MISSDMLSTLNSFINFVDIKDIFLYMKSIIDFYEDVITRAPHMDKYGCWESGVTRLLFRKNNSQKGNYGYLCLV